MKAIDEQTATVIIRMIGFKPILTAVTAIIGIRTAAIAVFEAISVANETTSATTRMRRMIGSPWMIVRDWTMLAASPLWMKPFESAMPPPKRIRMPQGIFTAHSQSIVKMPSFRSTGRMKRRNAPKIAMVESWMPGKIISRPGMVTLPITLVFAKIQARAVMTKTASVQRSPTEIGPSFSSSSWMIPRA